MEPCSSRIPAVSSASGKGARIAGGLMLALLCQASPPAQAAGQPPLAWACWISEQTPISIKCIRDRSHLSQTMQDNPEAALMNLRPDPDDALPDAPGYAPRPGLARPNPPGLAAPDEPEDELEAGVLDQIYGKILANDTSRLDEFVESHASDLRMNSVLAIAIHTLPLESSWLENRPARIVKSALCRGYPSCAVILREPGR